jgi:hypothetical protein
MGRQRVTRADFVLRFASVREVGKVGARLRPVLEVEGFDRSGEWSWSCWVTGTLDGLVRSYLAGECPVGIVLDRLEEYPEEVGGGSVPVLVLAFLRSRLGVGSLYADPV